MQQKQTKIPQPTRVYSTRLIIFPSVYWLIGVGMFEQGVRGFEDGVEGSKGPSICYHDMFSALGAELCEFLPYVQSFACRLLHSALLIFCVRLG